MRWVRNGVAAVTFAAALPAAALDWKATLEAEGRAFYEADGTPVPAAASATLEAFQGWDNDKQRITAELFQRYDAEDRARTHADLRELYWQSIGDDFEFRLGNRRVYWGVTESRHLVDVINQSDLVEDIDAKSKLGAPMLNVALLHPWGVVDFFLLPYQRARTFWGPEGRPRLPFPVNANEAFYEASEGQHHLDVATRYAGTFGPFDIGVAWFDGTARDPHLLPCLKRGFSYMGSSFGTDNGPNCNLGTIQPDSGNVPPALIPALQAIGVAPTDEQARAAILQGIVLVPYYDRLRQVSVDAQYVYESLALKLEALHRARQTRSAYAAVGGLEYNLGDIGWLGADVSVLGEWLWDQDNEALGALFDDELFFGTRLGFNDAASTAVLAGVTADRANFKGRYGGIEASRRIGDDWRLSLKARMFAELPDESAAKFLEKQDYVTLALERFF